MNVCIYLSIYVFMYLCIYVSMYLSICLSICLSIYLPTYPHWPNALQILKNKKHEISWLEKFLIAVHIHKRTGGRGNREEVTVIFRKHMRLTGQAAL